MKPVAAKLNRCYQKSSYQLSGISTSKIAEFANGAMALGPRPFNMKHTFAEGSIRSAIYFIN